jgi:hypothetical protein
LPLTGKSPRARRQRREIAGITKFADRRPPPQKRVNDSPFDDPIADLFQAG